MPKAAQELVQQKVVAQFSDLCSGVEISKGRHRLFKKIDSAQEQQEHQGKECPALR